MSGGPAPAPLDAAGLAAVHSALLGWYAENARDLPWRYTRDTYAVLVSEVMLQQTQVDRVLPKYAEFLDAYPTVQALASAPRAEVIRRWAPLGYNLRAVRLHRVAAQVAGDLAGRFPDTIGGLLGLKGIGPYTAGAVACFAFGQRSAFLDTNIRRVLARVFHGAAAATVAPEALMNTAQAALPDDAYHWNQGLMDLGAGICRAARPRCNECPLSEWCRFRVAGAPVPAQRVAETASGYRTGKPFQGSRRYYRGRIVAALRAGSPRSLMSLGVTIKPGYGAGDEPWLREVVDGLVRDGLATWVAGDSGAEVSLP